jgi:lipoate-protein ligase A
VEAVPGEGELTPHTVRGPASALHASEPTGDAFAASWLEVERPALVLGSTQKETVADVTACERRGVDVAHRRSGGGSVLMIPGEILWLDVIVPRGDERWDDDIGRSMWWLGEAWATALRACGVGGVGVHRDRPWATRWSRLVCFDGAGAGEVLVAGDKAVGISQRRTRNWARLQSAVHVAWRPEMVVELLAEPRPAVSELSGVWTVPDAIGPEQLRAAVAAAL